MRTDTDFSLTALLPRFMQEQADDVAFAEALSPILRRRAERIEQMQIWGKVDTMDDAMLDAIAAALHIQWWKADWDIPTKREMLAKSEEIRLATGTKWALEFVLRKWFGDETLQVQEWFDYGGAPYTFRILTNSPDVQRQLQFSRIMESIKRTSQSMDGIFLGFSMRGSLRLGAKGSESRTDHGQAMAWPYIPKGTRYTHPDALEELLWESGQTGTDAARAAVADATGTGGVLNKDFPLIFAGDDTSTALPIRSTTRAAYQQAMASQWALVGAEIAEPATSWVWPREAPPEPSTLLDGIAMWFFFEEDPMSGTHGMEQVKGVEWAQGSTYTATAGKVGSGEKIVGPQTTDGLTHSGDYDLPALRAAGDGRTIAGWLDIVDGNTNAIPIFCSENGDNTKSMAFRIYNATTYNLGPWYSDSNRDSIVGSLCGNFGKLAAGWHHFAVTWEWVRTNVCAMRYFVDGQQVDYKAQASVTVTDNIGTMHVGKHLRYLSTGNATCDEVGVWNRALSADEVAKLYRAGLDGVTYPFEGY